MYVISYQDHHITALFHSLGEAPYVTILKAAELITVTDLGFNLSCRYVKQYYCFMMYTYNCTFQLLGVSYFN